MINAKSCGIAKILEGIESRSEDAASNEDFDKRASIAMAQIVKCVDDKMKLKLVGIESPADAWKRLKDFHEGKSRSDIQRKRAEMEATQFKDFDSMSLFLDTMNMMAKQLQSMGDRLCDEDVIIMILRKVLRWLKHAAAAIRQERGENKRGLDEVIKYLVDEASIEQQEYESRWKGFTTQRHRPEHTEAAFSTPRNNNKRDNSSGKGHYSDRKEWICYKCGRKGHIAKDCRYQADRQLAQTKYTASLHATFMAFDKGQEGLDNHTTWWIDSGA
jgi:hypothetical protein